MTATQRLATAGAAPGIAAGRAPGALSAESESSILAALSGCACKLLYRDKTGGHRELQLGDGLHKADRRGTYCAMHLERQAPALQDRLTPTGIDGAEIDRINLYISPPGAGAPMHFDTRCILIVQLSGRKLWQVGQGPAVPQPLCNVVADETAGEANYCGERLTLPDRMQFALLRPGDWLMLPWGTWHGTYSRGGAVSATLAFAYGVAPRFPTGFGSRELRRLPEGERMLC